MKSNKREITEVDASSIADIAFILFAFIIVVTTLEKVKGVPSVIPIKDDNKKQNQPDIVILERNVMQIMVNKNNQLYLRGKYIDYDDIPAEVEKFMTNFNDDPSYPQLKTITLSELQKEKDDYQKQIDSEVSVSYYEAKIQDVEKKIRTCELQGGSYKVLPDNSIIAIKYDVDTEFGVYVKIKDKVIEGINKARNDFGEQNFGYQYTRLLNIRTKVRTEEQQGYLDALTTLFPEKVIDLKPMQN